MAGLVDFTTFNDIRAALGVSTDDLKDTTLSLDVYYFNLVAELEEMEPSPLSAYTALVGQPVDSMSEAEQRFYRATRLFATYSVARQLGDALPLFAPKEHSDGKASLSRFALDPYKETLKRIESQYEKAVQRLAATYATLTASSATARTLPTLFAAAGLASDPVTGS